MQAAAPEGHPERKERVRISGHGQCTGDKSQEHGHKQAASGVHEETSAPPSSPGKGPVPRRVQDMVHDHQQNENQAAYPMTGETAGHGIAHHEEHEAEHGRVDGQSDSVAGAHFLIPLSRSQSLRWLSRRKPPP